jgi:hypothetical protein
MSITVYSELKTAIADFIHKNNLTSVIDDFIDLCEAEMQRKIKLLEFETTGTVAVTAGVGTLPTGFIGARALSWDGAPDRILQYVTPDRLNRLNASDPSYVNYYSITGSTITFANDTDGTLNITYMARFTPLSGSATTNAILTNHPSAYLYGSLVHASIYCKDPEGAIGYQQLFDDQIRQINSDNQDRKYAGASLQVRVG